MKIAILSFYFVFVERGVENWTLELTRRLSKKNQIHVFQAGNRLITDNFQKIELEVDWDKIKSSGSLLNRVYLDYKSRLIFRFSQKTLKEPFIKESDIIIPTNGGWQSLLCKLYSIRHNKKLVIVGHSGIGWDDRINLLIRPNVFVALTEEQKKWAQNNSFGVKIEKISDGVDIDKFNPIGEKVEINLERPIILVVSSLLPQKRIDLAILAVSKLKKGSLLLLGNDDSIQAGRIVEMGKKLLGDRFLHTHVPYQNISKWYRSVDLVTFPSFPNEAFGMVLLEAMASNIPVIVTDDPVRREIVGEGGLFCNPQDIDSYSETINKALNTDFANKPRNQAEKFSWDNIVDEFENLFLSL